MSDKAKNHRESIAVDPIDEAPEAATQCRPLDSPAGPEKSFGQTMESAGAVPDSKSGPSGLMIGAESCGNAATPGGAIPAPRTPLKPLDLEAFAIKGDPEEAVAVTSPVRVRVGKPSNKTWFQTYPDESNWKRFFLLKLDQEMGEIMYLVAPEMVIQVEDVVKPYALVPFITPNGDIGFWPIGLPDAGGRWNSWPESAMMIAVEAKSEWRRLVSDKYSGSYNRKIPLAVHPGPEWPTWEKIQELRLAAFNGRIIDSEDHPEIRKLLLK
ncbi:MAG TPA: hypothetical protein VMN36_15810 [Verrucomicrobiales bacterium]|nr:hypothetical protein [Verrucomicrobiales bacterium]